MSRGLDILFATHNGARTLPRMLAALEQLEAPARPWRVIAVDNASTDETPRLLQEAAARLPLTLLRCAIPGKMPALKQGARALAGDLVIFTDDDVEPCADWLRCYEAAADAHPDAGLFGGAIAPTPLEPLGPWFEASRAHHAELFARAEHAEGPVAAADHIYGPNFMIRTAFIDVLDEVAAGLGPTFQSKKAASFAMGEDTQIMELLAGRGVQARFLPQAEVRHLVRAFQTDLDFMLARAERHGRGVAIRWIEQANRSWLRRARVAYEQWRAWRQQLAADPAEPGAPSAEAFERLWNARWALGAARGAAFGPFP